MRSDRLILTCELKTAGYGVSEADERNLVPTEQLPIIDRFGTRFYRVRINARFEPTHPNSRRSHY